MTGKHIMRYAIYGDSLVLSLDLDAPMTDHPAIAARHILKRPMTVGGGRSTGLPLANDLERDRVVNASVAAIWPSHLMLTHPGGDARKFDLNRIAGILAMHYDLAVRPEPYRHAAMFHPSRPELAMTGTTDVRHYFTGQPYGNVVYRREGFERRPTKAQQAFVDALHAVEGARARIYPSYLTVSLHLGDRELAAQGRSDRDWWRDLEAQLRNAFGPFVGVRPAAVMIRPI